ncbi:MAG: ATP-binding protein [Melioribacteraceae bacterium]
MDEFVLERSQVIKNTIVTYFLFLAVNFGSHKLALFHPDIAVFWISSSIALAISYNIGKKYWSAILLAVFFANISNSFLTGTDFLTTFYLSIFQIILLYLTLFITTILKVTPESITNFRKFFYYLIISSIILPILGSEIFSLFYKSSRFTSFEIASYWFFSLAFANLTITPSLTLYLFDLKNKTNFTIKIYIETILFFVFAIFVTALNYSGDLKDPGELLLLFAGQIPLGIYSAIRLKFKNTLAFLFLTSIIAIYYSNGGYGPFANLAMANNTIQLFIYLFFYSIPFALLSLMIEEMEKIDKQKSEFLASVSHEIRSPIHTITSFLGLLKESADENKDPEMIDSIRAIDASTKRLLRTVNLLLDMTKIQMKTIQVYKEEIDLELILMQNVKYEHKPQAENRGLELTVNIESKNNSIKSDEYIVTQLLNNLLSNSIKYTKVGKIDITLSKNSKNRARIVICDTGIGMSKEFINELFKPFKREDQVYIKKYEGTGLGMALVKSYCELIGAKLNINSELEKGTTFTIDF